MKKVFSIIIFLFCSVYIFAEDVVSVSSGTANDNTTSQVVASTDTVKVSSNTENIDITKPLTYKEAKENKDIVVSSTTVIPDENDLGTYYSSGAIVERPQNDSKYDLNIPTTTALGIAGEQVLDKLNLNKSTDTAKTDVNQSTTTTSGGSSKENNKGKQKTEGKKQQDEKEKSFTKKMMDKLPFDSKLVLSGSKLIVVNYSGTIYDI